MSQWYRAPMSPPIISVFTLPTGGIMGYSDGFDTSHIVRSEPSFDVLNGGGMMADPPPDLIAPSDLRFRMCAPIRWQGVGGKARNPSGGWHGAPYLTEGERGREPFVGPRFGGSEDRYSDWYHPDNDDYTNTAFRLYAAYRGSDANAPSARVPLAFQVIPHAESRPPRVFNIPRYHPGHRIELSYTVHLRTRMAFVILVGSARRISIFEEYEGYCRERLGNVVITGFCGPYQGFFLFRMRTRNQPGLPFRLEYPRYLLVPREYVVEERLWPIGVNEPELLKREWRAVIPCGRNEQVFDQEIASGRGTSFSGQFDMIGVRDSVDYPDGGRIWSDALPGQATENGEPPVGNKEASE